LKHLFKTAEPFVKCDEGIHQAIWLTLADSYLDQTMSDLDWKQLVEQVDKLEVSPTKLIVIDLLEVYPVLGVNLKVVAGEWTGFEEKTLVQECQKRHEKPWNRGAKITFWWRFHLLRNRQAFWKEFALRTRHNSQI